ncbi:hypothetical protein GS4_08_01750 [Gordonia soli NBRC 108243]|uniref:DUF3137 domain-containing protein n=2 Tax=Gordonia soli TaxID=320799 RepID=M0QG35_9ACTN|nr:hypothetical protein GS4_08_01750 [Gordonia soli NBRC 108243]
MLLLTTPLIAFVPAGIVVKLSRRASTRSWALRNGFEYRARLGGAPPAWDFPPFSGTRARRIRLRDGMTGRIGPYPATFFHYTWWNNRRLFASSHYRNVFTLRLPAALPRLTVGVTLDTSTGDTVRFESADFDDRFTVHSTDPAFAHAVLTPRTIDALVELSRTAGSVMLTKFEIADDLLVAVSTVGNRPEQITEIFDAMRIIAVGIPRFVWTDRGVAPPMTAQNR